jgi:hypothetical protein
MAGLELFQRMTIDQVAKVLELHPFEVVRILVADGTLPSDLRLSEGDVERVRARGGLETWWEGPPPVAAGERAERTLVRALARQVVSRGWVEPKSTRADNLFRGLDSERQRVLRRSVNALIREGVLASHMTAMGLVVSARPASVEGLREFAERGTGAIDRLWDQD